MVDVILSNRSILMDRGSEVVFVVDAQSEDRPVMDFVVRNLKSGVAETSLGIVVANQDAPGDAVDFVTLNDHAFQVGSRSVAKVNSNSRVGVADGVGIVRGALPRTPCFARKR